MAIRLKNKKTWIASILLTAAVVLYKVKINFFFERSLFMEIMPFFVYSSFLNEVNLNAYFMIIYG
ncbi:MAG: hypothetical protein KBT36_00320, partial [Kurthia sp.]|nr:hypothetical protein [Candidatus Kurthia equi]